MNTTRTIGLLVAALTTLVVTACGAATDSPAGGTSAPAGTAGPSAEHNDADVTFVQGMIPHHTQAVAMAQMATGQAVSTEVKDLAVKIEQAQGPQIEEMRGLLEDWGVEDSSDSAGGMSGMGTSGTSGTSGMMTDEQMTQLGQAGGPAFDRMFLQMMLQHHTGAVQMAQAELRDGKSGDARTLAQRIIDAQHAEITQMQGLLCSA